MKKSTKREHDLALRVLARMNSVSIDEVSDRWPKLRISLRRTKGDKYISCTMPLVEIAKILATALAEFTETKESDQ